MLIALIVIVVLLWCLAVLFKASVQGFTLLFLFSAGMLISLGVVAVWSTNGFLVRLFLLAVGCGAAVAFASAARRTNPGPGTGAFVLGTLVGLVAGARLNSTDHPSAVSSSETQQAPTITQQTIPIAMSAPAAEQPSRSNEATQVRLFAPIAPSTVDLAELSRHREEWPSEVTLVEPVSVPVIVDGREHGAMQFPRGYVVKLVEVRGDEIVVSRLEVQKVIPAKQTDLISRVRIAREAKTDGVHNAKNYP